MTPRQASVLAFVRERIEECGFAPKLEEVGEHFGFTRAYACICVAALVREKYLIRRARGMAGITLPGHFDLTRVPTATMRSELARRGKTLEALDGAALPPNEGRPCAANFCTTRIKRGMLMCRSHWFRLPREMRSAILESWAARDMQAYSEAVEAARDRLGGFTRVMDRVA